MPEVKINLASAPLPFEYIGLADAHIPMRQTQFDVYATMLLRQIVWDHTIRGTPLMRFDATDMWRYQMNVLATYHTTTHATFEQYMASLTKNGAVFESQDLFKSLHHGIMLALMDDSHA